MTSCTRQPTSSPPCGELWSRRQVLIVQKTTSNARLQRLHRATILWQQRKNYSMNLQEWAGVDDYDPQANLAIVFTDIIGSTTLARNVGNKEMFEMLVRHFESARFCCNTYGGCEIKLIGDAYMVVFQTADAALQFALMFRENAGDSRIAIRVGIHVGQVRIKDNDIYGLQVNLAERL